MRPRLWTWNGDLVFTFVCVFCVLVHTRTTFYTNVIYKVFWILCLFVCRPESQPWPQVQWNTTGYIKEVEKKVNKIDGSRLALSLKAARAKIVLPTDTAPVCVCDECMCISSIFAHLSLPLCPPPSHPCMLSLRFRLSLSLACYVSVFLCLFDYVSVFHYRKSRKSDLPPRSQCGHFATQNSLQTAASVRIKVSDGSRV